MDLTTISQRDRGSWPARKSERITMKKNVLSVLFCSFTGLVAAQPVLLMSDTACDNGTLPSDLSCSGGDFWESPDLWARQTAIPGYKPYPYPTATPDPWLTPAVQVNQNPTFSDPLKSQPNYVYVRVRNIGNAPSLGTEQLHVYWTVAAAGLSWPLNFSDYMDSICGSSTVYGMEITKPRSEIVTAFMNSPTEVQNYLDAVHSLATQNIGSYNYWFLQNQVHSLMIYFGGLNSSHLGMFCTPQAAGTPQADCWFAAHGSDGFLPWHREFLSRYELLLRQFNPTVTLLYWNWRTDPRSWPSGLVSMFTSVFGGFGSPVPVDIGLPWDDPARLAPIGGGSWCWGRPFRVAYSHHRHASIETSAVPIPHLRPLSIPPSMASPTFHLSRLGTKAEGALVTIRITILTNSSVAAGT
jgi:hypothetical protein